ncbi:MAG: CRISPR-associated protein Csy1 [Psychromonas sp.]|jgi:CRISPR-associated protein Csy1
MQDPAIESFFSDRKEAWLKKKVKASMEESEVNTLQLECQQFFSLNEWLPNAAKRAGQISMATHPCTFSHPSARKNKNGYVSSVIANVQRTEDGFLKTGNVVVDMDALGNAAALDVYKFLTLIMQDNRSLLTHIQQDSALAENLLSIKSQSYEDLKTGFLAMVESSVENITSSKIKQVYFPVDNNYHQLSLLTNSGMLYQLRKRIDTLRFSDQVKELRDKKRKNEFSEQGYCEIYGLTTIGYGGTKPQNISVLNNQNGGKAHLLSSLPPTIEKRSTHFPKTDFFIESFQKLEVASLFHILQKIIKDQRNNINIRDARDYCIQEIIDKIIDKMWAVRAISADQYHQDSSKLKDHQLTWLHQDFVQQRETSDAWLDQLTTEIARWISRAYENVLGKQSIKLGDQELAHIEQLVEQKKESLR